METLLMIKYGELTTKKANRKTFISILQKNIEQMLKEENVEIISDRVRMYIKGENLSEIEKKLKKVFGLHSIVFCYKVNTNVEEIKNQISFLLKKEMGKTFKIITKRADKTFPIPSMEFSRQMGAYILKNFDLKVDVHHPEIPITIEIRKEGTFLYTKENPGIGGYPVGIQGKGLLMLSGGIDSPVAGYLALKRGVSVEGIYFESPPHTSLEAKNKVIKLANILNEYSGHFRLHVVPFTKLQEEIYKKVPSDYMITIMRRMMYRICERYAKKNHFKILINGESIGQVASQTLDSMLVINHVVNLPVVRPVACFDKLEIIDLANKIGTYETSILPFEDCCTIFVPKHPVIHPELNKCEEYEKNFDFEPLIEECIEHIEVITDLKPKTYEDIL